MKLRCQNCGYEFDGGISFNGLKCYFEKIGWYGFCPECESLCDVNVPEGRIVMAFAWDETDEYFTDDWYDDNVIATYYAFDTPEEFIKAWEKMVENPDGMWYWVLDDGELVCSGACDPNDIDIFEGCWNLKENKYFTEERLFEEYGYLMDEGHGKDTELLMDIMRCNGIEVEKDNNLYILKE